MLIKLTSDVNFINVLWAAFAPVDPKSVKRYWQLDWILTLLGATGVKAVRKYVGEIDPRWRVLRFLVVVTRQQGQRERFFPSFALLSH